MDIDGIEEITNIGRAFGRDEIFDFGIKLKDRDHHMYIVGKTGMGKSTLLEHIAIQDIENGNGLIFMDPHGYSVDHIINYVSEMRIKDCIYFAPFDVDHPIAFNIMEDIGYDRRHLVASSLISAFKKIWGETSWSDRMEHILNNTLLALLEYPGTTLLDVTRMYSTKAFRTKIVENIKDPQVKYFWTDEFARYTDRFAAEATPAIQNKLGQFTSNPVIRNIIGQPRSSINFRDVLELRKLLLINLAKGRIGESNAAMLGVFFSTKIYLTALERADMTREQLGHAPPMNFIIDEFQSFASDTFSNILSEARKYKLNLVLAHQHLSQMEESIRESVFGNVGTMISFRVGALDAEILEKMFIPNVTASDLISLGKGEIYISLNVDGIALDPFSAVTKIPAPPSEESNKEKIIRRVRMQYATPRGKVESDIAKRIAEYASDSKKEEHKKDYKSKDDYQKKSHNTVSTKSAGLKSIIDETISKGIQVPEKEKGWGRIGDLKKDISKEKENI